MKRRTRSLTILALVCAALCALVPLWVPAPAYADQGDPVPVYQTLDELAGKRIGCLNGSVYDQIVQDALGGNDEFLYYSGISDEVAALKANKIDAIVCDEPVGKLAQSKNAGIAVMPEYLQDADYGYFFKKGSPLTEQFNEVLDSLEADGTLEALKAKWTGVDDSVKTLPEQDWETPNGTLIMATGGTQEPLTYMQGADVTGYDIEVALLVCKELGYGLKVSSMEFPATLASVPSGKADFGGGGVTITEERAKTVDFTRPNYFGAVVFLVRATEDSGAQAAADKGFLDAFADSFRKTFLEEDRWQLVLSGLGVTVLISVCAGVLGTLLGYATVRARREGAAWASRLVDGYQALMGGLPIVVILMVFYYVVFGSIDIAGEVVAILAFTLSFGSTAGTTMWTAVRGIDTIQEETGLALGYTRKQVFGKIIFPQAAQRFMPQLAGQFVSLVKETSVVGYIAVQDLTRASDLIRSRTMDAFFPLLSTALIYFLFCRILSRVLGKVVERLDAKSRPREIEGVQQ